MNYSNLIQSFYASNLGRVGTVLSYKEKQLLKEDKFDEFFELQQKRSSRRFAIGIIIALAYFAIGLFQIWHFAEKQDLFYPVTSAIWVILGTLMIIWFTRQYYIIKSARFIFQNAINQKNA